MGNWKRYREYIKYILRHKYFVYKAGKSIGCGTYRLLMHDMSKFLPLEFKTYARTFYKEDGLGQYNPSKEFNHAWLVHQKRNKHHWQYWLLQNDDGPLYPLEIPSEYVEEMVADWAGAGKAITGDWEIHSWYKMNKEKIKLHENTRIHVERLIADFDHQVRTATKNGESI